MALDKLVDSTQLDGALGSTADAIRAKTGGSSSLTWDMDYGFSVDIGDIVTVEEGTADATATANDILNGETAYVNGEKITGNIPSLTGSDVSVNGRTVTIPVHKYTGESSATPISKSIGVGSVQSGSATISTISESYNSTSGKFHVTGSANVSAPSVITAGYISTTEGTRSANNGGATVSAIIDEITGSTAITGTLKVTPSISKQNTPSGVTNAASGNATTDAPTGGVYVAVKATGGTNTITATPSVTAEGYGTADHHGITGNTASVGANDSAMTYVPVKTGSVAQNAPSVNASGLVTATSTVTEGYVGAGTKSNTLQLSTQSGTTVTPTESEQTAVASGKYTTGAVKVGAISSTYVGSDIPQNDSDDLIVSGATVSVPSGYYAEDASASVANGSVTQNAPTVNTSTGLVTATSTVTAGYVGADTKSNTLQLSTQGTATITPGTTAKTAVSSGKYTTGTVSVVGDADLVAGNIKKGVDIFGVEGTYTSDATATSAQIRSGATAYVNGSKVTGNMSDTVVTEGTTTVSGTTATRGEWSQTAGYTSARTIGASTFANSATSGQTYVDISATTDAPVLVSGGHLFINKGWTDNVKISLAKLVPDGASANLASGVILSGYSAYNNDGVLVAGDIPTKTALTVNGKTVTAPSGYYASNTSASVALGTVTSGTASITSLTKTYNSTSGKFDITGSANVSAPTVGTAGYVSSSEGTKNAKTGGATVSSTIDKIVGSTAITGASTRKPTINKVATPSGVTNAASGDATTTAPTSGVYVAVKSNANTGTLTATPSVTTAGYGTADYHGITGNTQTVGASASDTTYVPITTTSASISGRTVSYGTGWISEGNKSVGVGTVTSGSATISSASYAYNSTNGNFDVTGSASIGAPSVGTAGYISTTEGTRNGNTASLATTVAKIVGSTSITGTTTAKPSIAKQAISISGVTDAASGNATTTAPSSGVYVAVKSNANTGTLTATPSVSTAGYGTATNHGITGNTATVGASASDVTYVPITTTTASVNGKTVSYGSGWITSGSKSVADGTVVASVSSNTGGSASMGATGFTASESATDYYVTLSTTAGSVKAKATGGTSGYVTSSTTNETVATSVAVSGNNTKLYIPEGAYSPSVASQGTNTAAAFTPKVTGTITSIATSTQPSGTDGTDYWTITPDGDKTTGKARAKATATIGTAGYIPIGSSTTSSYTTWNITTNVNAGTASYIKKGAVTNNTSGGTSTETINRGNQIKIGAGYYPSDLYYTAQSNSGNKAITSSGSTSCDGYATVSVSAGTVSVDQTLPSGGSSSGTCTRGKYVKVSAGYYASDTYYLAQNVSNGTVSLNQSLPSGKTSSGTCNRGTYVKVGAGYYSADAYYLAQNVSDGTITPNTSGGTSLGTINWGSQIKIGAGYYDADKYYTAQAAPSGTTTLTTSNNAQTNIDIQAKQYVNVQGINVPKNKTFSLTATADTALDTTSNITITSAAYRKLVVTNATNGTATITNNGTIDSLANAGTITAITNNSSKTITNIANSGTVKVSSGSATAGTLTVNAYNNASTPTLTGAKSVVINGKWVINDVSTSGTYYGMTVVPSTMIIPNGNIQLTQATSTDVKAYATATVRAAVFNNMSGGGLSGTATASSDQATLSSTNNSGIAITTACTATRADVSCSTSTAGWASGTVKTLSGTSTAMTSTTYYVNAVSLPKSKSFSITVYTGASTQTTFVFTTDASGNTVVTG